jgi:response regulator of citrate/malate metabolism
VFHGEDVRSAAQATRATAQRYLSSLDVVRLELNYGSTGRRERRYRLGIR